MGTVLQMKRAFQHPAADDAKSRKVVIPVRYVARGEAVHTTSTLLSVEAIHVSSIHPPAVGVPVELKLFFPRPAMSVSRRAVVAEVTTTGFWAAFTDHREAAREGGVDPIEDAFLEGVQSSPRYPARLRMRVREADGREQEGWLKNVSASGAFVEVASLPLAGSLIRMEVEFPDGRTHKVEAWVAHVADGALGRGKGVGVQFADARAGFRFALDGYLAQLSRRSDPR